MVKATGTFTPFVPLRLALFNHIRVNELLAAAENAPEKPVAVQDRDFRSGPGLLYSVPETPDSPGRALSNVPSVQNRQKSRL